MRPIQIAYSDICVRSCYENIDKNYKAFNISFSFSSSSVRIYNHCNWWMRKWKRDEKEKSLVKYIDWHVVDITICEKLEHSFCHSTLETICFSQFFSALLFTLSLSLSLFASLSTLFAFCFCRNIQFIYLSPSLNMCKSNSFA